MNAKNTAPTPPTPTKTRSPVMVAGAAYNRINALKEACEAEIAKSPEEIRAKYAARIAKLRGELTGEAAEHLKRLLGEQ